jgi:hypothetical protein
VPPEGQPIFGNMATPSLRPPPIKLALSRFTDTPRIPSPFPRAHPTTGRFVRYASVSAISTVTGLSILGFLVGFSSSRLSGRTPSLPQLERFLPLSSTGDGSGRSRNRDQCCVKSSRFRGLWFAGLTLSTVAVPRRRCNYRFVPARTRVAIQLANLGVSTGCSGFFSMFSATASYSSNVATR